MLFSLRLRQLRLQSRDHDGDIAFGACGKRSVAQRLLQTLDLGRTTYLACLHLNERAACIRKLSRQDVDPLLLKLKPANEQLRPDVCAECLIQIGPKAANLNHESGVCRRSSSTRSLRRQSPRENGQYEPDDNHRAKDQTPVSHTSL